VKALLRSAVVMLALYIATLIPVTIAYGGDTALPGWTDVLLGLTGGPAVINGIIGFAWQVIRGRREDLEEREPGKARAETRCDGYALVMHRDRFTRTAWYYDPGTVVARHHYSPARSWHYHSASDEPIIDGVRMRSEMITACDRPDCPEQHAWDCGCDMCALRTQLGWERRWMR
jgi:hypothetical protein